MSQKDIKKEKDQFKNRKSPGHDPILNYLLKYRGDMLVQQRLLIIQKLITTNRKPDE